MRNLSDTQKIILEMMANGYTAKEIARQINRSVRTVNNHIMISYLKLSARNSSHAVAIGVKTGIVKEVNY